MYPSDVITNARHPVTLAGRELLFRPLEQWEWGELNAWIKSKLPSPVAVAIKALAEASKDEPVPQPVQDALFRQAQEESRRWPPRTASPDWFKVLGSIEGGDAQFLHAAAKASGCEITLDDAREIDKAITRDEYWWVVNLCVFGEQPVPKAGGEATPPIPSRTTGDGSTNVSAPSAA